MDIGPEVARIRKEQSLSTRDLQRSSGVDHARITRIENLKTNPSHKDVILLGKGLKLPDEVLQRWLGLLAKKILQVS